MLFLLLHLTCQIIPISIVRIVTFKRIQAELYQSDLRFILEFFNLYLEYLEICIWLITLFYTRDLHYFVYSAKNNLPPAIGSPYLIYVQKCTENRPFFYNNTLISETSKNNLFELGLETYIRARVLKIADSLMRRRQIMD